MPLHPKHRDICTLLCQDTAEINSQQGKGDMPIWPLVWRSGNGVGHIDKVKLRWARLVLGLVTTFGRSTN